MSDATDKIETHAAVLAQHHRMTKEEGEHFIRHFKGILHGVGELVEERVKQLIR